MLLLTDGLGSATFRRHFSADLPKFLLPFGRLGSAVGALSFRLTDLRDMAPLLVLLPLAPRGVWIGMRIARRISPALFYWMIHLGVLLTGDKLVWDALVH